jgi:hypothetical protein
VNTVKIPAPVLDSGAYGPGGTEGTGGNTATSTTGSNDCPCTKTDHASGIGQQWEVTNVDSPGFGVNGFHPTIGNAMLSRFRFNINFRCDFIFWTNLQGVSDNTDSPACRLYSSVSTNYWNVRFEATYNNRFVETVVDGPRVVPTLDGNETRLAAPVKGGGLETRLPDSLDTLKVGMPWP